MSKLNHTPGKWESHGIMRIADPECIQVFPHRTGGSFEIEAITIVVRYGHDDDVYIASVDGEANARLIAAAPDMLEALIMSYRIAIDLPCECDEYHGVVCGLHKWIRTLRDTIESATGLPIEEVLK
jgi:hypothetical protein